MSEWGSVLSDAKVLTALIGMVSTVFAALLVGLVVYPRQKLLDRRLEVYKGLIDASVDVLALANRLRTIVDNVCMDAEKLSELPHTDKFSETISQLDKRIVELQLLAPQSLFIAVGELRSALGRYRHIPIQRLKRWERESLEFSDTSPSEVEEDIQTICNELQFKFAQEVQSALIPLIGLSGHQALKKLNVAGNAQ